MSIIIEFFKTLDPILSVGIGLATLIAMNILFGTVKAGVTLQADGKSQFDGKKFLVGLLKGVGMAVGIYAVYLVGLINSDIIVIGLNGIDMNLSTATTAVVTIGYIGYGYQVIKKIAELIGIKKGLETTEINGIEVEPILYDTANDFRDDVEEN